MTSASTDQQTQALSAISSAEEAVRAAKRARSDALLTRAELQLHAAVDDARRLNIEWGRIGAVLGIARGCAYQRYRKPLSERSRVTAA